MSGRLFPHSCSVKRDTAVGTNGRMVKEPIGSAIKCLFIPMPTRTEVENGFTTGSGYDVYFKGTDADVKEGDQLTWDGDTFNVRAVRKYVAGNVSHKHVLASREEPES